MSAFNSDDETSPQYTPLGSPAALPKNGAHAASGGSDTPCCDLLRWYRSKLTANAEQPPIQIVEASKVTELGGSFVAYTIKVGVSMIGVS